MQSEVDNFMSARLLVYVGLLYEKLIKQDKTIRQTKILPPVLPLVIYNGKKAWDAPLSVEEHQDPHLPEALKIFQPNLRYWLLDESHTTIDKVLVNPDNKITPLIALEQAKGAGDLAKAIAQLRGILKHPTDARLRDVFLSYVTYMLKADNIKLNHKPESLIEAETMGTRVSEWIADAKKEGIAEGKAEGKAEGMVQANKRTALHLLIQGMDIESIAVATNMSIDEVSDLR